MHLEDLCAAQLVRPVDEHLAVEASRAQQCRVEDLRAIGRGEQDQPFTRIEAVHFDQQLVQGLLFLVVAAESVRAAGAAERVEFVDENDGRRSLARLLE